MDIVPSPSKTLAVRRTIELSASNRKWEFRVRHAQRQQENHREISSAVSVGCFMVSDRRLFHIQ